MGPPTLMPYWLRLKVGFLNGTTMPDAPVLVGLKKPVAFSAVLRKNSYAVAWKVLVPPCEATLTVAPDERPYSALSLFVTTANCATESGGTAMIWLSKPWLLSPYALLSMPSSRKLLNMLRWPLTLYEPARASELMELVVAAVGACRDPVTSPSRSL